MRFSVGINYWPRRSAMAMWQRYDPGEIGEDFQRIAALGLDTVRFFLRWADFQPAPEHLDHTMLDRLVQVMELLEAAGLRAMPTLFCGHMSGVNWLPSWAVDPTRPSGRFRTLTERGESPYGCGNFYAGRLLEAQRHCAREVGTALREHPAVLAWDLGNEFSNLREPAAPEDAREWSKRLTDDLQRHSGHPVTGGLHGEDLTLDRNIRPSTIAEPWIFATMHGYSVYSDFARSRTDPDVAPFLAWLTGAMSTKPVLFSEFGNPACPPETATVGGFACLDEAEMAVYARAVLERLHAGGRLGAYWWCWTDYDEALAATPPFDRAPHELRFGILRADGSLKPVGETLAAFAREARSVVEAHDPALFEPAYYADVPRSTHDAYARFLEFHL